MTKFFEWLEKDKSRLRKLIALIILLIWVISTFASYVMIYLNKDSLAVYGLITAQLTAVIGFYMTTKVNDDKN